MSAIETFRFGQFTLRPAGSAVWDYRLAKEWTAADPVHAGKIQPGFWIEQKPLSRDSYLVIDRQGPTLFFKTILFSQPKLPDPMQVDAIAKEMAVEIFMQFPPRGQGEEAIQTRDRIMEALKEGAPWLERVLKQKHIAEIFFESESPSLIRFSVKRLGFIRDGLKLRKRL